MPRLIHGRMLIASTITSLMIAAPAAIALATDTSGGDQATEEGTETVFGQAGRFAYAFDPVTGSLILDLFGTDQPDGDDQSEDECLPSDEPIDDVAVESATEPLPEDDLPPGCLVVDVRGPSGQINHGTVVSSVVHAIKAIRAELDGPLGHYIREIAGSSLGKPGDGLAGDEHSTSAADDHRAKSDLGNRGNSENTGPPEHSNAGGNGRGKNG